MMIGGANTEETDNAVSDAADLGRVLQENGQHGVAREVAKLVSEGGIECGGFGSGPRAGAQHLGVRTHDGVK